MNWPIDQSKDDPVYKVIKEIKESENTNDVSFTENCSPVKWENKAWALFSLVHWKVNFDIIMTIDPFLSSHFG